LDFYETPKDKHPVERHILMLAVEMGNCILIKMPYRESLLNGWL